MNLKKRLIQFATAAKKASYHLAELSPETKKRILNEIAAHLRKSSREIMRANQKDLTLARRMGLNDAMIDRLMLNSKRVDQMADAVSQVAKLPDPIGRTLHTWRRPNGQCDWRSARPRS